MIAHGADRCPLFKLFSARMRWLGQREVVLGQNIASADTPDYRPKDLHGRDFERLAAGVRAGAGSRLPVRATHPDHLGGEPALRVGLEGQEHKQTFEVSPDGNAVILEEQMAKMADTALAYQTTTNLYQKYLGMIQSALGTQS